MPEDNTEIRILNMVRQTLTGVIKDATPRPGNPHPLSQETLDNIKDCLGLITIREQKLRSATNKMVPKFFDENDSKAVPLSSIKSKKS